jgi:ankyrin repeat protein
MKLFQSSAHSQWLMFAVCAQACRNGLVQHLEQLLFYGADMNARNASGNTPLHVCAVNSQESCARLLLFRGCERDALNYANQTAYQVAVIAGNMELAEIIQSHRPEDAGESLCHILCMVVVAPGAQHLHLRGAVSSLIFLTLPGFIVAAIGSQGWDTHQALVHLVNLC